MCRLWLFQELCCQETESLNFVPCAQYTLTKKAFSGIPAACLKTNQLPQTCMRHVAKGAWSIHVNYGKSSVSHIEIFKEWDDFQQNCLFSWLILFSGTWRFNMFLEHRRWRKLQGVEPIFVNFSLVFPSCYKRQILQHGQIQLDLDCQLPQ